MPEKIEHKWDWCSMCGLMVRCSYCGNNCCNGGSGSFPEDVACPDTCNEAYEKQSQGPSNKEKLELFDEMVERAEEFQHEIYQLKRKYGEPNEQF